jgi:DNA-binding XRE family transcriptional regulator
MRLGKVIFNYRQWAGVTVRDLAKEIGTSRATLNRVERGYPCDSGTLSKILGWLLMPNVDARRNTKATVDK